MSTIEGYHHWRFQRYTAVALIPLSSYLLYIILQARSLSADSIYLFLLNPLQTMVFFCWLLAVFWHGYLGMEMVISDYVKSWLLRRVLLSALSMYMIFSILLSFYILSTL